MIHPITTIAKAKTLSQWWPVIPHGTVSINIDPAGKLLLLNTAQPVNNYLVPKLMGLTASFIAPSFWVGPVGGFIVSIVLVGIYFAIRDFVVNKGW